MTNVNSALLAGSIVATVSHPPATYYFKRHSLVDMADLGKKRINAVAKQLNVK